jgi:hypothetical protein
LERRECELAERQIGHVVSADSPLERRIAALAAHDVGNVIMRYRLPSPQTFTDRTNLPNRTKAQAADNAL